ncbi:Pkinase-domain-containing protein, partial [Wallemia mellicola]
NLLCQDLIRHGRNERDKHNKEAYESDDLETPSPVQQPARSHRDPMNDMLSHVPKRLSREEEERKKHAIAQQQKEQREKNRAEEYAREAEMIVEQERKERAKMPSYPGLEQYEIIEKMGDGAFSNVYKALDTKTHRKVAIKVVRKYELSSHQRSNILKEVQIMRAVRHENIIKLITFIDAEKYFHLVLELSEGGELFHQIVKLTYFSEELARHVITQVAEGIRYLHNEAGVVHRDIKPENILFDRIEIFPSKVPQKKPFDEDKVDEGEFRPGIGGGEIGKVKIADFGLSKVVWDQQTMTPCGTVGYTAPEIVKDERYSQSVDMWALGCVLYTILCGFPPFYDESIQVLTEKVAKAQFTFLSPWWDAISDSSKDLISHLLTIDPRKRYTIDEFFAHPWMKGSSTGTAKDKEPTAAPQPTSLDSPMLRDMGGNRKAMASPGVAQLKEAFDVTYAVHRAEEEGRRKGKSSGGGFLGSLNEEDEEEDNQPMSGQISNHRKIAAVNAARQKEAIKKTQNKEAEREKKHVEKLGDNAGKQEKAPKKNFELDLSQATLIDKRRKKGVPQSRSESPMKSD